MNKNYEKGRRFEYATKKVFEEQGYHVMRTSGSHGMFDLIAVKQNQILLIQCKVVTTSSEAARLRSKWLSEPPFKPLGFPATQVLAVKLLRGAIVYQNI